MMKKFDIVKFKNGKYGVVLDMYGSKTVYFSLYRTIPLIGPIKLEDGFYAPENVAKFCQVRALSPRPLRRAIERYKKKSEVEAVIEVEEVL